jgi:hypothetical protein
MGRAPSRTTTSRPSTNTTIGGSRWPRRATGIRRCATCARRGLALVYGFFIVTIEDDGGEHTMRAAHTTGMVRRPDATWLSFHTS